MTLTYIPPACGLDAVTETVPGRTFYGWRCASCDGPVRLTDYAAGLLTGTDTYPGMDGGAVFVHDTKSDHYWRDETSAGDYVVTFDARPVAGPGALDGLARMTLADARAVVTMAARIPKHGRIIHARTLETV